MTRRALAVNNKMHERGATSELQDVLLPPSIQVKGFARHLRGLNKKFKDTVSAARGCDCLSKACSGYLEYMKKLHQKFPEVELMDVVIDDAKKNSEVQSEWKAGKVGFETGLDLEASFTRLWAWLWVPCWRWELLLWWLI